MALEVGGDYAYIILSVYIYGGRGGLVRGWRYGSRFSTSCVLSVDGAICPARTQAEGRVNHDNFGPPRLQGTCPCIFSSIDSRIHVLARETFINHSTPEGCSVKRPYSL